MRTVWRLLARLLLVFGGLAALLLAPVAYSELACRPSGEPRAYQPILPPEHHRAESRTLMTYPEWHIVHAYEDYGRVLETGNPHDYGFFKGISGFWGSLCALSKASGQHGGVDSATKQMVYVIGVSFTAELALKAAYEETAGRIVAALRGSDRARLDELSARQAQDYAVFLRQTPWYRWDFAADAQALDGAATDSLRDWERALALGLEYRAKAAYARAIAAAVAEVGPDALTLRMIVSGIPAEALSQRDGIILIGARNEGFEIETPRYRALTHLLQDLAAEGADFVEIAGNDEIMLTILSDEATRPDALSSQARQGFDDHRHLVLARVDALADILRDLNGSADRLEHIHDY